MLSTHFLLRHALSTKGVAPFMRCAAYLYLFSLFSTCTNVYAQSEIASPAIDASLFREGAIVQREMTYNAWHLRCQEIVKIRRRFCNLLSSVVGKDGKVYGAVLLATDDTGQPAIMISVVQPIRLDKPLIVKSSYSVRSKKKPVIVEYKKMVSVTQCDSSCKFLFPADPKLLFSLNEGRDAVVQAYAVRMLDMTWLQPFAKTDALELIIRGAGFADALKASTETW